jgi:hypothetical protein
VQSDGRRRKRGFGANAPDKAVDIGANSLNLRTMADLHDMRLNCMPPIIDLLSEGREGSKHLSVLRRASVPHPDVRQLNIVS